jgi:hypothetical protein
MTFRFFSSLSKYYFHDFETRFIKYIFEVTIPVTNEFAQCLGLEERIHPNSVEF